MKMLTTLLLVAALLTDRWRIHALIWAMVISLGYFGVKGGAFTIITAGSYRVFGPPNTMIQDNNHLAAGLLVTLPLMNYLRLQSPHKLVRLALVLAMVLSLLAIVASYSRGALIGLVAVAVYFWITSSHLNKLVYAIGFGLGGLAIASFMPESWMERMQSIQTFQQDSSAMGRLNIWQASFAMALARPLTGAGFLGPYMQDLVDRFMPGVQARAVHSIYFEVLGEHGFLAFFVWLSMTVLGFANTVRILRCAEGVAGLQWSRDLARMGQVSMIAYLVAGAFLSLCYWDFYFTLLIVLAATHAQVGTARDGAERKVAAARSLGLPQSSAAARPHPAVRAPSS